MNDDRSLDEQLAHCDGRDCNCCASYSGECVCNADWTPAEVYRLRAERDALREKWAASEARCVTYAAVVRERDALRARIEDAPVGIINSPCLNNSPTWSVSGPYTKSLNGKRVALVVLEDGE